MKNFKLIKEYPGSPKLGETVEVNDDAMFTKYTEYWQEVYPNKTKVVDTYTGYTYTKEKDGKWILGRESINNFTINEKQIGEGKRFSIVEEPKGLKIHSGEIIAVGEKFYFISLNDLCCRTLHKNHIKFWENLYRRIIYFKTREEAENWRYYIHQGWFVVPKNKAQFDILKSWAAKRSGNNYDMFMFHCNISFNNRGQYRQEDGKVEISFDYFQTYFLNTRQF